MNELIEVKKFNAIEVFTGDQLDPLLKNIHAVVEAFEPDISTAVGRSDIASLAHRVARSKTFLDDQGKLLGDEARATVNAINSERKRMRDDLDDLKVKVRRPLTEYEAAEKARVEVHEIRIQRLQDTADQMAREWDSLSLDAMRQSLAVIEDTPMGDDHWQEFAGQAAEAKDVALVAIRAAIEKRGEHDRLKANLEQAEKEAEERKLEEHRLAVEKADKERDERIRQEAAEKSEREAEERRQEEIKVREREEQARREKEDKARQEIEDARLAAEKEKEEAEARTRQAEDDAKAAAEKAETDRIEAAEQAKRNEELAARRERDRIAADQQDERDAETARKADEQHREAINEAACTALVGAGLNVDHARKAVTAIQMGHVPNVRITY